MDGIDRIAGFYGDGVSGTPRPLVRCFQDIIRFSWKMKPTDPVAERPVDNTPPDVPVPDYRPVERFWPYVDLPEQPTDEELAALNPELAEALFGTPRLPFSVSIDFPRSTVPDYERAVAMARAAAEYREIGSGKALRHRARFYPETPSACATCSTWSAGSTPPKC